jgi:hypothetical protein
MMTSVKITMDSALADPHFRPGEAERSVVPPQEAVCVGAGAPLTGQSDQFQLQLTVAGLGGAAVPSS